MKFRRLAKIAALSAGALLIAAGGGVAAVPGLRHLAVAMAYNPNDLPVLLHDPRVHFEPGAENCAFEVAALLPVAIARVEAAQGRPFAHDVAIGVYVSPESFARANGLGTPKVAGVTLPGRLTLSPKLCGSEHDRLRNILTHELSHAHLQSWLSPLAFLDLPNWFNLETAVEAGRPADRHFATIGCVI